jgi:hypothetical protein
MALWYHALLMPKTDLADQSAVALGFGFRLKGRTGWLTQRLAADVYRTMVPNIKQRLSAIHGHRELEPAATIKKFLMVQTEAAAKKRSRNPKLRNSPFHNCTGTHHPFGDLADSFGTNRADRRTSP